MKAVINKIIPFSNVDGPGNRMSIFFQTCTFKCLYCHNPETINSCMNCGECVKHCPSHALEMRDHQVIWNQSKCSDCDTCIHICKHLASPKVEIVDVEELISRIQSVKAFIRGITVSGGECMLHADFLLELFKEVKKLGLTCLIDSNGSIDFKQHEELLNVSDGVMLDVKAMDPVFHEYLIHANNSNVIHNLKYLIEKEKLVEVRTVVLPNEQVQNEYTVSEVSKVLLDHADYKLIKYRPFGVREEGLKALGNTITSDEEIQRLKDIALENGATKIKII